MSVATLEMVKSDITLFEKPEVTPTLKKEYGLMDGVSIILGIILGSGK